MWCVVYVYTTPGVVRKVSHKAKAELQAGDTSERPAAKRGRPLGTKFSAEDTKALLDAFDQDS
eukprot:3950555-Pyramimonas_sp.AAC.2